MSEKRQYTISQICKELEISRTTLWRWIQQGIFERPCTPEGTRPRWKRQAIDNYLNAHPVSNKEREAMELATS